MAERLTTIASRAISRRHAAGLLTATASTAGFGASAFGQAKELTAEQVQKPGDLPDVAVGDEKAPVVIVEYASMTCPHCQQFHTTIYPQIKTKYIDAGKVRMIFREFPLDNVAAAASMLARCAGPDKTVTIISKLFETQEQWAFVRGSAVPPLRKATEGLISQEDFDKCLKDEALLNKIIASRERASKELGVNATPSFFINGKKFDGRSDQFAAFEQAIDPLLPK